jgi:hypothetical protein
MFHRFENHFGHNRCYSYVAWIKWKLTLVHLEIVLISTQDWCTVCTKCTIGSEITLSTPDGTPRWRRSRERSFQSDMLISTQDRYTFCAERTIGSEIILGTTDVTPR